jgi:hypothetical protein
MSEMTWNVCKEFTAEGSDACVRVTLSDKGIYSFHVGRLTIDDKLNRHFGIFVTKGAGRKIKNLRAKAIGALVASAEEWIQAQFDSV